VITAELDIKGSINRIILDQQTRPDRTGAREPWHSPEMRSLACQKGAPHWLGGFGSLASLSEALDCSSSDLSSGSNPPHRAAAHVIRQTVFGKLDFQNALCCAHAIRNASPNSLDWLSRKMLTGPLFRGADASNILVFLEPLFQMVSIDCASYRTGDP